MHIKLDFVLQKDNYMDLIAFYKFCAQKKVNPSVIYLLRPENLSIETLSMKVLEKFYNELSPYYMSNPEESLEPVLKNLERILNA